MTSTVPAAIIDLRRELMKARDALIATQAHLAAHAESNAALYCANTVIYSPLHARVTAAIAGTDAALNRAVQAHDSERLVSVLLDLDRCMHGRHQGDTCNDCGGPSLGNPHMPAGTVVGYDISARPITMPAREHKHDAQAWRGAR